MALHSRLSGFEYGEQVTALVRARLIHGVHIPIAGVGYAGRQLGRALGNGPLLKFRIAQGNGHAFVGGWTGRTGQRREIRKPGAVSNKDSACK